jgi:hypothetical protein
MEGLSMQTTPNAELPVAAHSITDADMRRAMAHARRMQAQAVAGAFSAFGSWLRGNPNSRARRISDALIGN